VSPAVDGRPISNAFAVAPFRGFSDDPLADDRCVGFVASLPVRASIAGDIVTLVRSDATTPNSLGRLFSPPPATDG
jgi:hypothetical protein